MILPPLPRLVTVARRATLARFLDHGNIAMNTVEKCPDHVRDGRPGAKVSLPNDAIADESRRRSAGTHPRITMRALRRDDRGAVLGVAGRHRSGGRLECGLGHFPHVAYQ